MTAPESALRAGVAGWLLADATLASLLRGPKIHDHPPRAEAFPYLAFGQSETRTLEALDIEAVEVTVDLAVEARFRGLEEAEAIGARVRARLRIMPPGLAGHRIVWLAIRGSRTEREPARDRVSVRLTLSALVESA